MVLRVPLEIPSDEKNVIALFLMYETWHEYYSVLLLLLFSESFAKAQRKKCSMRMCLRRIKVKIFWREKFRTRNKIYRIRATTDDVDNNVRVM